ncbi:caspase family protein [Streptomyces sp. NPDC059690]|uniref:caspase, EACC1-associated type n=1 Tax=Streptomyces sp. NPDC059690 TaxID=3346907 RepID=UPI00368E2382
MSALPDPELSHAVLIGLSVYDHLPEIPAVANNITALKRYLTSAYGWRLPPEHCVTVTEPRVQSDIIDPVCRASREARDTLLVYYAGHGVLDDRLQFYLSLRGSRVDAPWTCVAYDWVRRFLAQSRARRRVAILDSCFSGKAHGAMSAATDAVRAQTAAQGTVVVTSARDDRVALAPPGEIYTAFTGELLTVLHWGIPSGPDAITLDQAYSHVRAELTRKGRPRPDRTGSDTAGMLMLARNRAVTVDDAKQKPATPSVSPQLLLRSLVRRLNLADMTETISRKPVGPLEFGSRYRVEGRLGAGGMCYVYLAIDQVLRRRVAVKVMRPEHVSDKDFTIAMGQEARTVASLTHRAIAAVYDMDEIGGFPYFVMEYVRGLSLRELGQAARQLRSAESAAVVLDVLDALDFAHKRGVIHCDIKPANVMITTDGNVKVLDFGIAAPYSIQGPACTTKRIVWLGRQDTSPLRRFSVSHPM